MIVYGIYDKRTDKCVYAGSTVNLMWWRWGHHIVHAFQPNCTNYNCKVQKHLRLHGAKHFEPRHLDPEPGKPPFGCKEDMRKQEQVRMDELKPICNTNRAYHKVKCSCCLYLQRTAMRRHLNGYGHWFRMKMLKDGVYKFDKTIDVYANGAQPPDKCVCRSKPLPGAGDDEVPRVD